MRHVLWRDFYSTEKIFGMALVYNLLWNGIRMRHKTLTIKFYHVFFKFTASAVCVGFVMQMEFTEVEMIRVELTTHIKHVFSFFIIFNLCLGLSNAIESKSSETTN